MEKSLRFVWFWTFWHWSKEESRARDLDPLERIGVHWAEWFARRASAQDTAAVADCGSSREKQTQFIRWLFRCWAPGSDRSGNRLVARFALGELADVQPFSSWESLRRFRQTCGASGLKAIMPRSGPLGVPGAAYNVEVLVTPGSWDAKRKSSLVPDEKEKTNIEGASFQLACDLFAGRAHRQFFLRWLLTGKRAYSKLQSACIILVWSVVAGLFARLAFGPDPGERLPLLLLSLFGSWLVLTAISLSTLVREGLAFSREGRAWRRRLTACRPHVRTGFPPAETEAAGLSITLNMLLATYRAHPALGSKSFLWRSLFKRLDCTARSWSAMGGVSGGGTITQSEVELDGFRARNEMPVLPASARFAAEASLQVRPASGDLRPLRTTAIGSTPPASKFDRKPAAVSSPAIFHCQDVGEALMIVGGLTRRSQVYLTGVFLFLTVCVLAALPDLRATFVPARSPGAIAPSSPSSFYLWVSLDTSHPEEFQAVLESRYWVNRRVKVESHNAVSRSSRAEIPLTKLLHPLTGDSNNGIIWVERRRKFLFREFAPGERVGRYTLTYLNRLDRENLR